MSPTQLRSCRRGAFAVLLCVVMLPAAGLAQNWDVAAMAGVGIPFGDLGDVANPGFSASLSATRWMSPRWGIRVGGAGNFLGSDDPIPNLTMWHYNVGPEIDLIPANTSKFSWHLNGGVGATTTQVDGGDSSTDFTVNVGTSLEYGINDYFRIIGGPSLYIVFEDETSTVLPITAGFRYLFSNP